MTIKQEINRKAVRKYREIHPERVKKSRQEGYLRNKTSILTNLASWGYKRYEAKKRYWIEQKGGKCSACGGVFELPCYDFHHIDPDTKKVDSIPFRTASDKRLAEELSKCILLCSNCHRLLHYKNRRKKEKEVEISH